MNEDLPYSVNWVVSFISFVRFTDSIGCWGVLGLTEVGFKIISGAVVTWGDFSLQSRPSHPYSQEHELMLEQT